MPAGRWRPRNPLNGIVTLPGRVAARENDPDGHRDPLQATAGDRLRRSRGSALIVTGSLMFRSPERFWVSVGPLCVSL